MSGTHKYYVVIIEDVIISVPEYSKELVSTYCQEINTKAWIDYGKSMKESATQKGSRLIGQGLKLIARDLQTRLLRLASEFIHKEKRG